MIGTNILAAPLGADYTCSSINRIFVCVPKTPAALERFTLLQAVVQKIVQKMAEAGHKQFPAGANEVTLDGRPGPATTIATKFIANVFANAVPPPPEVAQLLNPSLTKEESIQLVAQHAKVLSDYFSDVLINHPEALRNDPIVVVKDAPRYRFTVMAIPLALGAGAAIWGLLSASKWYSTGSGGFIDP